MVWGRIEWPWLIDWQCSAGRDTLRCLALATVDDPVDLKAMNLEDSTQFVKYEVRACKFSSPQNDGCLCNLFDEFQMTSSVLWRCWLGHLTRKNLSPIWPIMNVFGGTLNHTQPIDLGLARFSFHFLETISVLALEFYCYPFCVCVWATAVWSSSIWP